MVACLPFAPETPEPAESRSDGLILALKRRNETKRIQKEGTDGLESPSTASAGPRFPAAPPGTSQFLAAVKRRACGQIAKHPCGERPNHERPSSCAQPSDNGPDSTAVSTS